MLEEENINYKNKINSLNKDYSDLKKNTRNCEPNRRGQ